MEERFLPIGTVVLLKGSDRKLMITEHFVFSKSDKEEKIYDYGSCQYPVGLEKNASIGFNHDSIEKVLYMGYVDDDQKKLNEFLNKNEEKIKKEIIDKLSK